MEQLIKAASLPQAYHEALIALKNYGELIDCPDWNTTCLETSVTIEVAHPFAEPMISKYFIGGPHELQQYVMEMLDGILDFEVSRGNWVYTYHDRMVRMIKENGEAADQVQFVIDELRRCPDSRRAVILVRNASDLYSEDPACLQHIQYFIRKGCLDCKVLFRSNDACKASFMNMFALVMLQKRIADALGLPVGTYTHRANSYHCYERDFQNLEKYVYNITHNDPEDCCMDYEDGWMDLMEEEIPVILETVENLKQH